jgi:hypothetical protein
MIKGAVRPSTSLQPVSDSGKRPTCGSQSHANVDKGGAGFAPPGGARGGAELVIREGISWGTQPDGRALPVSPRYQIELSTS